jgi:hypothetical protein
MLDREIFHALAEVKGPDRAMDAGLQHDSAAQLARLPVSGTGGTHDLRWDIASLHAVESMDHLPQQHGQ